MDMKALLTKAACTLASSSRLMTLDKVSHEAGVDREQMSQALETLASKGLIDRRSLEEFDEECYQANDATKAFCEKFAGEVESQPSPEQAPAKKAKASKKVAEVASQPSPETGDPVLNFLEAHQAPRDVLHSYEKVRADRDRYKHTAGVWEKHIKEMVSNVTRDLSS